MERTYSREQLIALVEQILAAEASEAEIAALIAILKAQVPDPAVTDSRYWPEQHRAVAKARTNLSAAEIVDLALATARSCRSSS